MAVYKKLLSEPVGLNVILILSIILWIQDLKEIDEQIYNSLIFYRNYNGNLQEDIGVTFEIAQEDLGVLKVIELKVTCLSLILMYSLAKWT